MKHMLSTRLLALGIALGAIGGAAALVAPAHGGTSSAVRRNAPKGAAVALRKTTLGAILVDWEGEAVAHVAGMDDYELKVLGAYSGAIYATGAIGTVAIGGTIAGGAGDNSGSIAGPCRRATSGRSRRARRRRCP